MNPIEVTDLSKPYTPFYLRQLGIEIPPLIYLPRIVAFHLQLARERSKKDIYQVAKACRVIPRTITDIEAGRRPITVSDLLPYCLTIYLRPQLLMEMVGDSISSAEQRGITINYCDIAPITDTVTPTQMKALFSEVHGSVLERHRTKGSRY